MPVLVVDAIAVSVARVSEALKGIGDEKEDGDGRQYRELTCRICIESRSSSLSC